MDPGSHAGRDAPLLEGKPLAFSAYVGSPRQQGRFFALCSWLADDTTAAEIFCEKDALRGGEDANNPGGPPAPKPGAETLIYIIKVANEKKC